MLNKNKRQQYFKNHNKMLREQTIQYKLLLNQELICLFNGSHIKKCKTCYKEKISENNFYLKIIKFNDNNYLGTFETECIECMLLRQKQNGKLFNSKLQEKNFNTRVCRKCNLTKELNENNFRLTQNKYLRRICLDCDRKEANESTKKRLIYARDAIRISKRKYQTNRRQRDPVYKMRKYLSTAIYQALRDSNSKKHGSIMNYLSYSIDELKIHLEQQFESWMSWKNMKKYDNKTWNNNDSNTWVWNLDHIVPQSLLPYISMEDDNFKKCWALENLRPYSAKQNIIDGNRRNRKVSK